MVIKCNKKSCESLELTFKAWKFKPAIFKRCDQLLDLLVYLSKDCY